MEDGLGEQRLDEGRTEAFGASFDPEVAAGEGVPSVEIGGPEALVGERFRGWAFGCGAGDEGEGSRWGGRDRGR